MHAPKICHLEAIDKILTYLEGTLGKKILMKNNKSNEVCGYNDSDWAENFDGKSTTGYYTFIGGNIDT
jgi:hypothetical protein